MNSVKVIVLSLIMTAGFQYVMAQTSPSWQAPTGAPPAGNTYAPLNAGPSSQIKDGPLVVGYTLPTTGTGLLVPSGKVGIGTLTPAEKIHVFGSASLGSANPKIVVESGDTGAARLDLRNKLSTGTANAWHIEAWQNGTSAFDIVESGVASRFAIAKTTGNVAVGGGATGAKPDATATFKVDGQIKITGGTPGAGKVLSSDSTGLASWTTPAGGSGSNVLPVTQLGGGNYYFPAVLGGGDPDSQDIQCPGNMVMTGIRARDWDDDAHNSLRVQGIYCKALRVQ